MRTHVVRVEGGADGYRDLIAAVAAAGERVGWLEMRAPDRLDESLEEAVEAGALRGVAVGAERSLAVKAMRGRRVLGDLLREHFKGCRLVLVSAPGEPDADLEGLIRLRRSGEEWELIAESGGPQRRPRRCRSVSTAGLVSSLRRALLV